MIRTIQHLECDRCNASTRDLANTTWSTITQQLGTDPHAFKDVAHLCAECSNKHNNFLNGEQQ